MKKNLLTLLAYILLLPLVAVSGGDTASAAQTKAQAAACTTSWQGKSLDRVGLQKFASNACSNQKGGNCGPIGSSGSGSFGTTTIKCSNTPGQVPTAQSGDDKLTCNDIKTSILKCNGTGGDPVTSLLLQVVNFLAVGVGIAVLGGIIWGGMLYASSNGESAKVQQGKMAIVNAIIGLVLFIFMYAIINFIVPGGLLR